MEHIRKFLLALLALAFLSSCFQVQGVDPKPLEHRTEYTTTGYTLEGCQENLDELAGSHVQMTKHAGFLLAWIYLGLLPVYTCGGYTNMVVPPPTEK